MLALLLWAALPQAIPFDWQALNVSGYPEESRAQIAAARDAYVKAPASAEAAGQLGLVLHAWEQFDLAAQAYGDARRLAPASIDWWVLSGSIASRTGRHDLAAQYFGKAVTISPSPLLALRHADALLDSGQVDAARAAYEVAVKMPDAEPAARYGLGRIALAAGDTATARTELERAVALVPTFGAAHYALAQVQRKTGDLAGARASIARQQQCLACWPVPEDRWAARVAAVRTDAAAIMREGIQLAGSAQDDARAIALHEKALERDAGLLQARVNLITLYARTGNLAGAEAQYRAVVAAGTQLAEAHRAYGLALVAGGEPARAEPILRQAVEGSPLDAAAQNALGLIAESARRIPEAEAAYRRAVDAEPRVRGFRYNLARVLVNSGRLDEALAQLTQLHAPDDAESARYVFATAAVHVRKGDVAEGRRLSEEALARARRHGLTDLAAAIERDLQKIR